MNFFDLFKLSERYEQDNEDLENRFYLLQARFHPDNCLHQTEAEKKISLQMASTINEAYTTLRDPIARALYLLKLKGFEGQTQVSVDFLTEQLELREALIEIDESGLRDFKFEMAKRFVQLERKLKEELKAQAFANAHLTVQQLQFYRQLQSDINTKTLSVVC